MKHFCCRILPLVSGVLVVVGVCIARVDAAVNITVDVPAPFPAGETFAADDPDNGLPQLAGALEVAYPEALAEKPVADRVWVAFLVDSAGKPQKVRPMFGRHPELEQAVVAAVERVTFSPGRHDGKDVFTQMTLLVTFEVVP